jgi:predicted PurR-regulated permease PerM
LVDEREAMKAVMLEERVLPHEHAMAGIDSGPSLVSEPATEQNARSGQAAPQPTTIWISHRLSVALALGAIALLVLAIWRAPGILAIMIGGIALAQILSFPVRWLSRAMPRGLAVLVSLLLLVGLIALALVVLLPLMINQLTGLLAALPSIQTDLNRMLEGVAGQVHAWGMAPETVSPPPEWQHEGAASRVEALAADFLRGLLDVASGAVGFAIQFIAAVTIAIYLLLDVGKVRGWFVGLAPQRYRQDAAALWDAFATSFSRYLGGVVVVAFVAGALSSVAFWILGVPFPLLLGGWVAFCALIPVFGTYLGIVPALLLALAQSPHTAALTILAYVAIQQVEDNVLTPRVQGETAHVPAVVILLAVLWTGMAFGVFWAVLAVPALVAARVVYDFFRARLRVRPDQHPVPR